MARCHRIGQSKPVKIYRLVTRGTYETSMFQRASMKLGLDQAVLKKSGLDVASLDNEGGEQAASNALSSLDKNEIESLLRNGAYALLDDPASEAQSASFCEADIDSILADRTTVIKTGGNDDNSAPREASTFSQAVFASSDTDARLDVNDKLFWEKLIPDERSAHKLTEKLFSGAAYASAAARAEFMHHLEGHVSEIVKEYQQGNSLEHVPLILDLLKTVANSSPPDVAAAAAAPAPASTAMIDVGQDQKSSDAAASTAAPPPAMGWTRDQIRQCAEWLAELEKPRRQRKVAERYTDLSLNGAPVSASGAQPIESAFKRRLHGKILNGMGGIVFSRKQRKSLSTALLDLAGVLPYPRAVLTAHTGSASLNPNEDGRSSPTIDTTAPTTEEQMAVWYTLRAALEPSLQDRKLSELIGFSLSFFGLLISLSDAQDIPIFTAALERLRACVPSQEELDVLEAAESKVRRKKERHNAIRKMLAEQIRQKIAQTKRDATRASNAASDALVKLEPSRSVSSTPLPPSATPQPEDDPSSTAATATAVQLESATLETAVGTIKVEELLAEEGAGQTFSSGGKRVGRPQTVGLNTDTATLIQMQPHLIRGSSVEQITVDNLQDEYNDAQESFEAREEAAHYARFHRDCLKATLAHFPSLSEDLPFVKYLAKRCKRWARFMLLATQLRLELNEFEVSLEAEAKDRAYILGVAKQYLPAGSIDEPRDQRTEEEETAFIEGAISIADEEKAAAAAAASMTVESAPAPSASASGMDIDSGSAVVDPAAVVAASSPSPRGASSAPISMSPAHRRILANLAKASISDLKKSVPSLAARAFASM
jgi:hypothetical protein